MGEFLRSEELNGEGETVTAFWTGYCGVLFGCKNIPEKGYFCTEYIMELCYILAHWSEKLAI